MKLVISTAPAKEAPVLARTLVEKRLVACVNIVPKVRSIYVWEGKLCDDEESLIFIKTVEDRESELVATLKKLHSYDVPEIISVEIDEGASNEDYINWVIKSVIG